MRTKIDYGVDLGTTNSAIAKKLRMANHNKKIGYTKKDTIPSCVSINKKKTY